MDKENQRMSEGQNEGGNRKPVVERVENVRREYVAEERETSGRNELKPHQVEPGKPQGRGQLTPKGASLRTGPKQED
jgi:hypothetical protein